jgi:hypothetical protein
MAFVVIWEASLIRELGVFLEPYFPASGIVSFWRLPPHFITTSYGQQLHLSHQKTPPASNLQEFNSDTLKLTGIWPLPVAFSNQV